ncbi:transcription-Repair coupling factor [Arthrobacter sp. Hiyo8]|nr:transcription-Repair coupling factor [Arthrobacter sp. Hiyo8]
MSPKGQPSAVNSGISPAGTVASLDGLRRALGEDRTFARVRPEASRAFTERSSDYQISAPRACGPRCWPRWPMASPPRVSKTAPWCWP